MRVSPFGYPGITAHLRLPRAFRSLSRPSSAPGAGASAPRPFSLDLLQSAPFRLPFPDPSGMKSIFRCADKRKRFEPSPSLAYKEECSLWFVWFDVFHLALTRWLGIRFSRYASPLASLLPPLHFVQRRRPLRSVSFSVRITCFACEIFARVAGFARCSAPYVNRWKALYEFFSNLPQTVN